jgi:hypothetical protein
MTILIPALIWTLRKPAKISRTWAVTLMFAAIVVFMAAGLTSCDDRHECRGGRYLASSSDTGGLPLVRWEDVFGPRGPMEVEVGGRIEIRHVPIGMMIRWDRHSNQAWNTDGCRVRVSERISNPEPYQQPEYRQQPMPRMMVPRHNGANGPPHIQPYPPQRPHQPYPRQQRW